MLILSPDLSIFLKSYIRGLPVTGCITNLLYSLLNYIFLCFNSEQLGKFRIMMVLDTKDSLFFNIRLRFCLYLEMPGPH